MRTEMSTMAMRPVGGWRAFRIYLVLQWKRFIRSASFGRKLAVNLFMGLLGLVLLVNALFAGWMLVPLLNELFPGEDALGLICNAGVAWCMVELALRMFFQQPNTLRVRPLLILPVRRGSIIHFVLTGSIPSFLQLAVLLLLLTLGASLIHHGYGAWPVAGWCTGMLFTSLLLGQLSLLMGRGYRAFLVILLVAGALAGAHAMGLMNVFGISRNIFLALYAQPWLGLVSAAAALVCYGMNFRAMRSQLHLEGDIGTGPVTASSVRMAWADRFGTAAPFIRMDLRMIWRNKRPRSTLFLSMLFLLYGLVVRNPADPKEWFMLMFMSLFMTGFLVMNFGQYIPAWDSAYFPLLMTQAGTLRAYLRSKVLLLRAGVLIMSVLTLPYILWDLHWAMPLLANMLFNLGITLPMVLFFGSFNTSQIELGRSAFGNWQGVNASRFLLVLFILAPAMIVAVVVKINYSPQAAMTAVAGIGVAGMLAQRPLLRWIETQYAARKHKLIAGFKEN